MNEAQLTRNIVKALRADGAFAVKIHGGPHQPKGLPDVIGCYLGRFFGFEVKMPGREDTLTVLQEKKLRDVKKAGGYAAMITSVKQARKHLRKIRGNSR